MDMDTIVLKFEAIFSKMKSDLGNTIKKWEQLDNATSSVSNNFEKMANSANASMDKLAKGDGAKAAGENLDELKNKLKELTADYKSASEYFNRLHFAGSTRVEDRRNWTDAQKKDPEYMPEGGRKFITKESLAEQKAGIDSLKAKIKEVEDSIQSVSQKKLIPKVSADTSGIDKSGESAKNASKKFDSLGRSMSKINVKFSGLGKITSGVKNTFGKFTDSLKKNVDSNFRQVKKLALGLIGVRTAMALLTRGVNAYLSFDSELQDSINNSWNMLGALLAPAIELVAQAFALATNYIAQFVSALSGIDLVARANAKALQTQAKANEQANKAQRGLLSMDEITNLPTEPGGAVANQIKAIDTKPIKWLNDLLGALKKHKWHRAGEIIAESITNGLRKIDWDTIRERAEQTGKNIATFLNGVFEVDWRLIGSTFANGLNTLVDLFHGFFTELEWGRLGAGLGNTINGFFNDFDFTKAAETITNGIVGLLDTASAFIVALDVEKITNSIVDFVEGIDWLKIGEKIIELLIHGIRAAITIKKTLLDRVIDDIETTIDSKIEELGEHIGGKLGNAVVTYLKNALKLGLEGININIPGTKIGIGWKPFKIPGLATGTNEIEKEGLYHLHEGEAVVPKRYNPTTGGYDNGSDNQQIINLLVALNANMIDFANRPIDISMNSKKVAEAIYDDTEQITRNKNTSSIVVRS